MKSVVASAVVMAALIQVAQAQDVAAGEQSFKKCFPCHSIGEGAKNKVGPVLNGLDGRHSGTVPITIIPTPTRIPASPGTKPPSWNTSRTHGPRFRTPR